MSAEPAAAHKPVVRRSLAEAILSCPSFRREDNERLAFGSAFHRFAAAYTLHLRSLGEETDLTAVSALAAGAWAGTLGLRQDRFDEFAQLCERFAQTHVGGLATLLGVEETLVWDAGWAVLTCTLDRQDRSDAGDPDDAPSWLTITDHKTEWSPMAHWFQVRWYCQMRLLTMPSLDGVNFAIDHVRFRQEPQPVAFRRGELDQWWEATLAALRRRLRSSGERMGGHWCAGCALRRSCAESIALARAVPESDEEADRLLAEWQRLAAAREAAWGGLQEYYRGREPRVVSGVEVGFLAPREERLVITADPLEVMRWAGDRRVRGVALEIATIRSRKLRERLVEAGLAELKPGAPEMRVRKQAPGESEDQAPKEAA